jgi:hypothetical protein
MPNKQLSEDVVNPRFWADPKTITLGQLQSYQGLEHAKLRSTYKNFRASLLYMGGMLGGFLIAKVVADRFVQEYVFGENRNALSHNKENGGLMLNMHTYNEIGDYTYNRQF